MKLSQLKADTHRPHAMRIGRGGKRGKTSGRGTKGQRAHGSHGIRPEIKDRIRKLPKLRGRGLNMNKIVGPKSLPINLSELNLLTATGTRVDFQWLKDNKLVPKMWKSSGDVKILGFGEITHAIVVVGIPVSTTAKLKIEAAKGTLN